MEGALTAWKFEFDSNSSESVSLMISSSILEIVNSKGLCCCMNNIKIINNQIIPHSQSHAGHF